MHGKRFVYKFVCNLEPVIGFTAADIHRLVDSPVNDIELLDDHTSVRAKLERVREALKTPGSFKKVMPTQALEMSEMGTTMVVVEPDPDNLIIDGTS